MFPVSKRLADNTGSNLYEEFLKKYNSYEIVEDTSQKILPDNAKQTASSTSSNPSPDSEIFANNITEVLEFLIAQADKLSGKPAEELSREEKIEFVSFLDQKGAFLVTKSSERVCEHLKISRFTLYNYLDLVRKDSKPKQETTDN